MGKLPRLKLGEKPYYRKLAEDIDFYALFQNIEKESETCFYLESLGVNNELSRYSIIGFSPQNIIVARENNLFTRLSRYPYE